MQFHRYGDRAPRTLAPQFPPHLVWHSSGYSWRHEDSRALLARCPPHAPAVRTSGARRRHALRSVHDQLPHPAADADSKRTRRHRRRLLVHAGLALHDEIIRRWQAGVPVRILMDPRANPDYPRNSDMIAAFRRGDSAAQAQGERDHHWKMMLFAGQNTVEFGSANYSPDAFVPQTPYIELRVRDGVLHGRSDRRQQLQDQVRRRLDRHDELQRTTPT